MEKAIQDQLERLFVEYSNPRYASGPHLKTLRELAANCQVCVEFGCKHGASAVAMLLGTSSDVWSYDIQETPRARALEKLVGPRWHYRLEDTRYAAVPDCDLLFVDSMHNYEHVQAELWKHAGKVRRFIAFHDTITFGSVGAVDESGKPLPGVLGIRPAIDELLIRDPGWRIVRHDYYSHGFLVLAKRV